MRPRNVETYPWREADHAVVVGVRRSSEGERCAPELADSGEQLVRGAGAASAQHLQRLGGAAFVHPRPRHLLSDVAALRGERQRAERRLTGPEWSSGPAARLREADQHCGIAPPREPLERGLGVGEPAVPQQRLCLLEGERRIRRWRRGEQRREYQSNHRCLRTSTAAQSAARSKGGSAGSSSKTTTVSSVSPGGATKVTRARPEAFNRTRACCSVWRSSV